MSFIGVLAILQINLLKNQSFSLIFSDYDDSAITLPPGFTFNTGTVYGSISSSGTYQMVIKSTDGPFITISVVVSDPPCF
jgi:hypothetical protein